MKNWKTTLAGILTAIGTGCATMNGKVGAIGAAVASLGVFILGLFAQDSDPPHPA